MTAKKQKLPSGYIVYQNKCYAKAKTAEDKTFLKKHLQKLVETLQKQEKFWLASWGLMKCPQLPSETNASNGTARAVPRKTHHSNDAAATEPVPAQMEQQHAYQQQMYQHANPYYAAYTTTGGAPSYYGSTTTTDQSALASDYMAPYNSQYTYLAPQQAYNTPAYSQQLYYQAPDPATTAASTIGTSVVPSKPHKSPPASKNKKRKRDQQAASQGGLSRREKKKKQKRAQGDIRAKSSDLKWKSKNDAQWDFKRISALPSLEGIKVKPLVGTCKLLEKDYVRLTSESDPSKVRPQNILEQTLTLLKHKYLKERADYAYMCNQLKSMRQDLTVQCIQNEFTVRVYESHARIALQNDDLNQFNQCQSQLKMLYAKGLPGNREEFTAYRIMYYAFVKNFASLTADLRELSEKAREDPHIQYALSVIHALNEGNLCKIFGQLYDAAPKMSSDLILVFAASLREDYLLVLGKSHSPTKVTREFLQKMLGLKSKRSFREFMKKYELPESEEMYSAKDIVSKIREHRINLKQK